MDENANTDDADRSPFRRFPYVQLVFSVVCLAMTAWTWMRFSYCHSMKPVEAIEARADLAEDLWPAGAYVELDCLDRPIGTEYVPTADPAWHVKLSGFGENPCARGYRNRWSPTFGSATIITMHNNVSEISYEYIVFEAESRFHPASIAGIVVGAMGVFIFGLYLRAWLRERKALASQPQRDMTA